MFYFGITQFSSLAPKSRPADFGRLRYANANCTSSM